MINTTRKEDEDDEDVQEKWEKKTMMKMKTKRNVDDNEAEEKQGEN